MPRGSARTHRSHVRTSQLTTNSLSRPSGRRRRPRRSRISWRDETDSRASSSLSANLDRVDACFLRAAVGAGSAAVGAGSAEGGSLPSAAVGAGSYADSASSFPSAAVGAGSHSSLAAVGAGSSSCPSAAVGAGSHFSFAAVGAGSWSLPSAAVGLLGRFVQPLSHRPAQQSANIQ